MKTFEEAGRRRIREVFEHRPSELLFSVNGFVLSSLKVTSERSEQTQTINIDEKVSFVEVFSDQGVRLLFLDVEPLPDGQVVQTAQLNLSDDRKLELNLSFSDSQPTLRAVYLDPLMKPLVSVRTERESEVVAARDTPRSRQILPVVNAGAQLRSALASISWLRPAPVTAVVAALLIAALVILRWPARTVSAAELLRKSAASEEAMAARTDQALRRTIMLEERVGQTASLSDDAAIVSRRKIEIWHSAEKGTTARRLFGGDNRLLAGEWRKSDGSRMLYQEGARLQSANDKRPNPSLSAERVWLLDPSAKSFSQLIGRGAVARVQESPSGYLISYEGGGSQLDLVKASIALSKADLHATALTLVVNRQSTINRSPQPGGLAGAVVNQQWIEYRFTETSLEQRALNAVAPAVFEPDPLLFAETKNASSSGKAESSLSDPSPAISSAAPIASSELEVEALDRLNRVNAFQGEQLNVSRTPEGTLVVSGIVETAERKKEVLQSLGPLANKPAVKIEINTVAEAQARIKPGSKANVIVEDVQVAQQNVPAEAELRNYFSSKGLSGDQLEQQIKQLSQRVIGRSTRARSHALAIKQIVERFSVADLQSMDPAARAQWRAMIAQHAQSFRRELEQARQELTPIFPNAAGATGGADIEIKSDEDIAPAAKRLFELAAANDVALRRSFSLSNQQTTDAPVKSAQFWRSFNSAEMLATRITDN